MPSTVQLLAFSDDVGVMWTFKTPRQMEKVLKMAINRVIGWMTDHGLVLSLQKTEIVVLSRNRRHNCISLNIGAHRIQSNPIIRYLGVQIDSKMNFRDNAAMISVRAAAAIKSVSIIMANTRGPKERRRRLIASVVNSKLLYASQVWWTKLANWRLINCMRCKVALP